MNQKKRKDIKEKKLSQHSSLNKYFKIETSKYGKYLTFQVKIVFCMKMIVQLILLNQRINKPLLKIVISVIFMVIMNSPKTKN